MSFKLNYKYGFYIFYKKNINIRKPTSSIRSFNTEVTTEPHKHEEYSE